MKRIFLALLAALLASPLVGAGVASADRWCTDPSNDERSASEKRPKQGVIETQRYSFGNSYAARSVEDDGTLGFISLNGHTSSTPLVSAWETPAECFGSAGSLRTGGWGVTPAGQVFTDSGGEAGHYGDMNGQALNKPIVGMAPTPTGLGYWLVASDGGMFTFGDARFLGSTGAITLNRPIVAMAATPTGNGYWLAASDGGLFTFGDARFLGSMGATTLNQPVVGMVPTASGRGYWMVAADGGIFTFGDASFLGSTGGQTLGTPVAGMIPYSGGYAIVTENGTVYPFAGSGPDDSDPAPDPEPEPEPAPEPEPEPEPEPQTIDGEGDDVTSAFAVASGLTVFDLEHDGESNFAVWLIDPSGDEIDLLANEIGDYEGSVGSGLDAGNYRLEVTADGPWSVTVTQPRPASGVAIPRSYSGTGDDLVGPFDHDGAVVFAMSHDGESNFAVWLLDEDGETEDLLANEIGDYEGEAISSVNGISWLNVSADGPWTISLSE